jgi:hypothetical protein
MTIRFSDGVAFERNGALHIVRERDGLYVVGEGCLIPVADEKEALQTIATLKHLTWHFDATPAA